VWAQQQVTSFEERAKSYLFQSVTSFGTWKTEIAVGTELPSPASLRVVLKLSEPPLSTVSHDRARKTRSKSSIPTKAKRAAYCILGVYPLSFVTKGGTQEAENPTFQICVPMLKSCNTVTYFQVIVLEVFKSKIICGRSPPFSDMGTVIAVLTGSRGQSASEKSRISLRDVNWKSSLTGPTSRLPVIAKNKASCLTCS